MLTSPLIYNLTRSIHARSDPVPVDPDVVKQFFSEIVIEQYFNVALASALVYHSFITIDQEVKYFWPRPLNSISLIYFANRYVGLLGAISCIVDSSFKEGVLSCKSVFWMVGLCNLVTLVLIDCKRICLLLFIPEILQDAFKDILVVRVLALYHQDRRLAIFLKLLIGIDAAIDFSLLIYSELFQEISVGELAEGITVCGALRAPPEVLDIISWYIYRAKLKFSLMNSRVIPMSFGLLLLSLALYKAAEHWRLSSGFRGFYLVKILVRDQVWYYGCVILCSILKIGAIHVLQFNPFVGTLLDAAGSPTLLCILGGQLLINLKEAGELGINGGTNYRLKTVSDIEFAEGAPKEEGQTSENVEDIPSSGGHSSA